MKARTLLVILSLHVTLAAAQNAPAPAMGNDPFGRPPDAQPGTAEPPSPPPPPLPPVPFRSHAGEPLANASLPSYVKAELGDLTLFADIEHPEARGIPLYLINRTGKSINFDCQEGDVYIKLEMQTPDGQWERAQDHQNSDCGNSYYRELLPSGMHFRMLGYQPTQGEPAKIRYVCYGSEACTSNAGEGLYTPMDVKASQTDSIAWYRSIGVIHSHFNPKPRVKDGTIELKVAILKLAEQLGEVPAVRSSAAQWLKELEAASSPTAEQRQAIPILRDIIQRNWGVRKGHTRILQTCLDAVKTGKNAKTEFGSLQKYPEVAWEVIQNVARIEACHFPDLHDMPKTDNSLWKEIVSLAAAQVQKAPRSSAGWMIGLLGLGTLANDFLPDETLEPFVLADDTALSNVAVHALATRLKWERLAELGFKLKPESQLPVLLALVRGPYYDDGNATLYGVGGLRTSPQGERESEFWLQVIKRQPVEVASALYSYISNDHNAFSSTLFEPLKAYWRKETENSDRAGKDFELKKPEYEYRLPLEFLAAFNDSEDLPLLRSLLRHHGHIIQKGSIGDKPYTKQAFVIRHAAAEALKQRGETLPADLVLEVDLAPGAKKQAP